MITVCFPSCSSVLALHLAVLDALRVAVAVVADVVVAAAVVLAVVLVLVVVLIFLVVFVVTSSSLSMLLQWPFMKDRLARATTAIE